MTYETEALAMATEGIIRKIIATDLYVLPIVGEVEIEDITGEVS